MCHRTGWKPRYYDYGLECRDFDSDGWGEIRWLDLRFIHRFLESVYTLH